MVAVAAKKIADPENRLASWELSFVRDMAETAAWRREAGYCPGDLTCVSYCYDHRLEAKLLRVLNMSAAEYADYKWQRKVDERMERLGWELNRRERLWKQEERERQRIKLMGTRWHPERMRQLPAFEVTEEMALVAAEIHKAFTDNGEWNDSSEEPAKSSFSGRSYRPKGCGAYRKVYAYKGFVYKVCRQWSEYHPGGKRRWDCQNEEEVRAVEIVRRQGFKMAPYVVHGEIQGGGCVNIMREYKTFDPNSVKDPRKRAEELALKDLAVEYWTDKAAEHGIGDIHEKNYGYIGNGRVVIWDCGM